MALDRTRLNAALAEAAAAQDQIAVGRSRLAEALAAAANPDAVLWVPDAPSPPPTRGPGAVDLAPQRGGVVRTADSVSAIHAAVSASNPGDTVQVVAGRYGPLTLPKQVPTGYVRVVPAPGAKVDVAAVNLTGAQGLDLRGLNLYGDGARFERSVRCAWRGGVHLVPNTATCFIFHRGCLDIEVEDFLSRGARNTLYAQAFSEADRPRRVKIRRWRSEMVSQDHFFGSRGSEFTVELFTTWGHTESPEHQDGIQIVGLKDSTFRLGEIGGDRAFRDAAIDRNDHGIMVNYTSGETPEGRVPERLVFEDVDIHDQTSTGVSIAGGKGITLRRVHSHDNGRLGSAYDLRVDPDTGNVVTGLVEDGSTFPRRLVTGVAA